MAKSATATDMFPFGDVEAPLDHGGDLSTARRMFPGAVEPFIDLSTGINPNPYPLPPLPAELFARLPDAGAAERLAAIGASRYGAPSPAHVVAAPGTQILLALLASMVSPGHAVILAPTYNEHPRAARLAGHAVTETAEISALADADLAIVTNPNNPDGRLIEQGALCALAEKLRRRGGVLLVDEAFMDVGPPRASLAAEVTCGNVVVLRSFGKFFGLAGLRLGFALTSPARAAQLSARLGPWAVSGPALAIGTAALADAAWIEWTRRQLTEAAQRLDAVLAAADLGLTGLGVTDPGVTGLGVTGPSVIGGTALFRLVQTPQARALFHHLGRAGILVRSFPDRSSWLRFGLPGNEEAWRRLQIAMAAFGDNR
jgi:cobalamin biosynthetic protein CobC